MDIAGLSMAMNQSKLQDAVSLSVMKIAMNTGKQTATDMTEMLKMASDPNVGQHLDVRV